MAAPKKSFSFIALSPLSSNAFVFWAKRLNEEEMQNARIKKQEKRTGNVFFDILITNDFYRTKFVKFLS